MSYDSPVATNRRKKFDEYDVRDAARTLIKAQEIPKDPRKGFYAAVKKELGQQAVCAEKAALEAKVTAKMHKVFGKGE